MTLASAFKCREGAIVATADGQGSREGLSTAGAGRIFPVREGGSVAFATRDVSLIETFLKAVDESEQGTALARLREAASGIDKKTLRSRSGRNPRPPGYRAVYATEGKIYSWSSGDLPKEETRLDRVIVGDEVLVSVAEVYVKLAEFAMRAVWSNQGSWSHYSTKFVGRFCWLLTDVVQGRAGAGGREIYELKEGAEPRHVRWDDLRGEALGPVEALVQSLWEEIPPKDLVKLDRSLGVLPKSLKMLFYEYGEARDSWD